MTEQNIERQSIGQKPFDISAKPTKLLQWIILIAILLAGFGIRLVDLKDAPLDFHPVRQLRSALIARSIYYDLSPDFTQAEKDLAQHVSSLEVYEPPILETLTAWTYLILGGEKLWAVRILLAAFWILGGIILFILGRQTGNFYAAAIGLSVYSFLQIGVIASRAFQPEPFLVFCLLVFVFLLFKWSQKPSWKWAVLAGLVGCICLFVKIISGFFIAALLVAVCLSTLKWKGIFKSLHPWFMGIVSVLPALLYYLLFFQSESSGFFDFWFGELSWLVLDTEFYADWLAMLKSLFGLTGILLAVLGIVLASKRLKPILIGSWAGYILYGLFFPYQYVTHEYYHLLFVPIIALSIVSVMDVLINEINRTNWFWRFVSVGVILFAAFYMQYTTRSVLVGFDYRNEPESWRRVGEAIPQESSFVALTGDYGMRLRYFGWRVGANWPASADFSLKSLVSDEAYDFEGYFEQLAEGKDYFLVTSFSELDKQPELKDYLQTFPVYYEGNGFILYDIGDSD